MRLELTRVGLLVELANHYTTRGAYFSSSVPHNLFVLFGWFLRLELSGRIASVCLFVFMGSGYLQDFFQNNK